MLRYYSKLEIPVTHNHSKSPARQRHRGRRSVDVTETIDTEVAFKTEVIAATATSPRGRQTTPRRRSAQKRPSTSEDVPGPVRGGRKQKRRSMKDRRQFRTASREGPPDSCMPPPLLAAVNSATSSSRTTSPERPLPHLTAAVIPHHHQLDFGGFPEHQPDVVADVLGWKLVPDEFLHQQLPPPSLVYGAHHLLRLFGKFRSSWSNTHDTRSRNWRHKSSPFSGVMQTQGFHILENQGILF